jgi:hypothetical protein
MGSKSGAPGLTAELGASHDLLRATPIRWHLDHAGYPPDLTSTFLSVAVVLTGTST